ncbi:MAG: ATP-binding protein [Candidatus Aenigmarchaeota archaeon]|nr:ATP-binding protein [Candidatus Aenigmarchaeota archaeon]
MRIAITGGKGGTGKSVISTSLAGYLSKKNSVLLVDADVDCPNDHLILSIERKKLKEVKQMIPKWNFDRCIKCGKCSEACKANAILQVKNKYPIFFREQCNGCGACLLVCPENAITKSSKTVGNIFVGKNQNLSFLSGELMPGELISELIVDSLKKEIKGNYDFILIDTAAGTHCDVIAALDGCNLALAVTEPTPLGEHDLDLILQLTKKLDIPTKIILNRSDIAKKSKIKQMAKNYGVEMISEIPYSKKIQQQYSKGELIKDKNIEKLAEKIEKMNKQ